MAARQTTTEARTNGNTHQHRTAKVIELIGTSTKSFEEAIRTAMLDAEATLRGLRGAHVENMSVTWENGRVAEYKVNLKVAFGIEHSSKA